MDTTEAIKALMSVDRGAEVQELVEKANAAAEQRYRDLREDKMTSADAQRWEMAVVYTRARREIDKQLIEMGSRVVRSDRDDAERVFGVKGLSGDAASLVISRRDAGDRVAKAVDRDELRELLARATRSGDEVLARAVAERAVENQDNRTMEKFLADRPELQAAGERLWNMKRAEGRNSLMYAMTLTGLAPPELQGMGREAIEALAENQPA